MAEIDQSGLDSGSRAEAYVKLDPSAAVTPNHDLMGSVRRAVNDPQLTYEQSESGLSKGCTASAVIH